MTTRTLPPLVSWHRGGHEIAPSATLDAFAAAAGAGAEAIEVDVRQTRDGRLVCVHDRAVPGVGIVAESDWAALEAAQVLDLTRFLDVLDEQDPERRSEIHLDLKETGYEAEAIDSVLEHGRRLFVTTLEDESVAACRRAHPEVRALLTLGRAAPGKSVSEVARLRRSELAPWTRIEACGADGVAVHYLLATPFLRRWCRRRGLQVVVWTVDDERALRRWLRRDVDVVTTNRPLTALRIRSEQE